MVLFSERLKFGPLSEKHFEDFKALEMDPDIMQFIRKPSETEEEARARFDRLLDYNKCFPDWGAFALTEKDTGTFIGMAVLVHIEMRPENKHLEVGYRLGKGAWGKGYATELTKRLISYGFSDLGLTEIFATTNPEHVVSQKVLMKAGMKDMGIGPYYNAHRLFKITNEASR